MLRFFKFMPYGKTLKQQHGGAECAQWWCVNDMVMGGFITTTGYRMTDFSPLYVYVIGLIRSNSHYAKSVLLHLFCKGCN